jgi:hypothetical protein
LNLCGRELRQRDDHLAIDETDPVPQPVDILSQQGARAQTMSTVSAGVARRT